MGFITWDNSFSVGVPSIDAQHRRLVSLVDRLFEAMKEGQGKQVLGNIIEELVAYTKTHFTHEEQLMQRYGYPNYPQHKVEHDQFVRKAADFQARFQKGHVGLSVEVLNFLKNWLVNHILKSDKGYSPFLTAQGAA